MAKTITEKIESIEEEMQQLANQRKMLIQQHKEQERKDRTRRLCKRAGLMESMLPDTIHLNDDKFKTFLEKALLSDYSHRILDKLLAQSDGTTTPQPTETTTQTTTIAMPKPSDSVQRSNANEGANRGNATTTTV